MAMTKDQIFNEAMTLGPSDREALAEELLRTLSDDECASIDAAWLDEVRRRDAAFARGQTTAAPVDEVIARVLARARP